MSAVVGHAIRKDRIPRSDIALFDQDEQPLDGATQPRLHRSGACQFVLAALPLIVGELQRIGQQFPKTLAVKQPTLKEVEYHVVELLPPHAGASAAATAVHSGIATVIGIAPALACPNRHAATAIGHAAGCDFAAALAGKERSIDRLLLGNHRGNHAAHTLSAPFAEILGDRNHLYSCVLKVTEGVEEEAHIPGHAIEHIHDDQINGVVGTRRCCNHASEVGPPVSLPAKPHVSELVDDADTASLTIVSGGGALRVDTLCLAVLLVDREA